MIKLGMDGKLYRNTSVDPDPYANPEWTEITNVKDVTLNLEKGEADVTTRANQGWRASKGTLKEGSVEFEMAWDPEDAGFTAIKDAWFNGTTIELAVMDGDITEDGTQGLRATMSVISFTRNEPLEEAMSVNVTVKPTYADNAPEWMTVTV
jgi:hypothetical protein